MVGWDRREQHGTAVNGEGQPDVVGLLPETNKGRTNSPGPVQEIDRSRIEIGRRSAPRPRKSEVRRRRSPRRRGGVGMMVAAGGDHRATDREVDRRMEPGDISSTAGQTYYRDEHSIARPGWPPRPVRLIGMRGQAAACGGWDRGYCLMIGERPTIAVPTWLRFFQFGTGWGHCPRHDREAPRALAPPSRAGCTDGRTEARPLARWSHNIRYEFTA